MSISLEYNSQKDENKSIDNKEKDDLDSSLIINQKYDEKFRKDMNTILSMGYDGKMMRKIYIFLKPNDINEALDYMSKQDGIYHHDFMERYGQKNKCFICGEPPKNHINYDPKNSKTSIIDSIRDSVGYSNNNELKKNELKNGESNNILNEPLINSDSPKNLVYCDLCAEQMTEKESIENKLPCKHLFCNDCYLNFLQEKITNNKVGKITCMQFKCPHEFEEKFIISHLNGDEKLINKYKKFKLRNNLYNEENIKFCPIKDCDSYARKEGDNKYVTCLEGHKFCFECSNPWHGKKKCQEIIDKKFDKWKKKKLIKRCPKCKFWTEKNSGCNHMTCPECKFEWCWFCVKKCEPGHFKIGGPCYGLQFTQKNCFNNCLFLNGYKLMIWLLQALMLIFYVPSLMIAYGMNINLYFERYPKPLYFMTFPLFIISFFTFFTGLGTIFFVVCLFVWCLKKRAITFLLDLAGY